jgi:hypothetical protein
MMQQVVLGYIGCITPINLISKFAQWTPFMATRGGWGATTSKIKINKIMWDLIFWMKVIP